MSQDTTTSIASRGRQRTMPQSLLTTEPVSMNLVPHLMSIAKSVRALMGLKLSTLGLHPGQDELILALEPGATVSVSVLADLLAVRPSTVSKMLDRLVASGLVERTNDVRDARRTFVSITPLGIEMQVRIRDVWQWFENELKDRPPGDDLTRCLQELRGLLSAKLRRIR